VNGGRFVNGAAYTVTFPTAGNYKLVCLIHRDMTGVVHVLGALPVPHDQAFYDDEAADQGRRIISDTDHVRDRDDYGDSFRNVVITTGELVATGGGRQYLSILRFLPDTIRVHVGETVDWANLDPTEPHTITFVPAGGTTPGAGAPVGVTDPDSDVDRHGTLPNAVFCGAASGCFSSGIIGAALQDQTAQTALGVTRTQVTFTTPGIYDYFCILHSDVGMKGKVVVLP
jgi:plastocyanin